MLVISLGDVAGVDRWLRRKSESLSGLSKSGQNLALILRFSLIIIATRLPLASRPLPIPETPRRLHPNPKTARRYVMTEPNSLPSTSNPDLLAQLQHGACRFLCFEQLAQGKQEILIEFKGQIYRLRATKNGKLILNK